MKRKWIKYTLRALLLVVVAWSLILTIAFFYIRHNKQKIVALIKSGISQNISGTIDFDDLSIDFFHEFPGVSVDLKNIYIIDSPDTVHSRDLLQAQHLYVGFGVLDLLLGKKSPKYVTLANGQVYLFTDSSGRKNWNILKKPPVNSSRVDLNKISLKNMDVVFDDRQKSKFFEIWFRTMKCSLANSADRIRFRMTNDAVIKKGSFDTEMGSYLTNKKLFSKWDIGYDKNSKKISLKNQEMRINNQRYAISAEFLLGENPYFSLNVETTNLSLDEAASIFPLKTEKKINQFKLSRPLARVQAFLSGPMKYLNFPVARIYFYVQDASIVISPVKFDHCSFDGFFKNVNDSTKPPDDRNSVIQFSNVKGDWEKNSFDSKKIFFYNLIHPYMKCGIHLVFKLNQLQNAIASRRIDFNGGDGEANLDYEGPLAKADTSFHLDGTIRVQHASLTYNPRDLHFKNTDIDLEFQQGDMQIKTMNTEVNNDMIRINGRVKGFLNFFDSDSSKANFEWNIYSPYVDLGRLAPALHRTVLSKRKQGYSFLQRLNDKIDRLFDDCNAFLVIKADKLVYKNFSAADIKGKLTLKNDLIGISDLSLHHAGGTIMVNATSIDHVRNSDIVVHSTMRDVNVKELFVAFNNFGLQSLTSKNIEGRLTADINLNSVLDENNNLYKPANKGSVIFSLQEGRLKNFQPLMDIDNNFLQKRGLSDISFAELRDRFDLSGNDVQINRMEIKSTAINMYVEGTYSFANNTDLSIQIPLRGQKTNSDAVPENKGNNSKGGISIFLRAKDDKDGKLKIGYDLLGRFRNKK